LDVPPETRNCSAPIEEVALDDLSLAMPVSRLPGRRPMPRTSKSDLFIETEIDILVKHYVDHIRKDKTFYIKDEGYKYGAVATFQEHFDLSAKNFVGMLEASFARAGNLVASGQYFPKRMLLRYATKDPRFVRAALKDLLDHSQNVGRRIDTFITTMNEHFKQAGFQSYFDYRFVSFILAARYPERYIYTKFKETTKLAEWLGCPTEQRGTSGERYLAYWEFSELLREALKQSPEFRAIHREIVAPYAYKDPSLSWGVVDFVFNCVRRLDQFKGFIDSAGTRRSYRVLVTEQYQDAVISDEYYDAIDQMSREQLLKEAAAYEAKGEGYKTVEKTVKLRIDSAIQKLRVKKLEEFTCQVCVTVIEYKTAEGVVRRFAHADHIRDKAKGGNEELGNLWVLCPNCHALKTYGVIVVDPDAKKVYRNGKEITIRDNHLGWAKK
jgi:5-methylcytosine-specific restriction endonuclease McrA